MVKITLDKDLEHFQAEGVNEVTQQAYGWSISELEWELDLRITSRQDGRTSWGVILTEVDGEVKVKTGLCDYEKAATEMLVAATELTLHWIHPIMARRVEKVA